MKPVTKEEHEAIVGGALQVLIEELRRQHTEVIGLLKRIADTLDGIYLNTD